MKNHTLKMRVRRWMELHVEEHATATELAEDAADIFDLHVYNKNEEPDIPEWVFEMSAEVKPAT